MKIKLIIFLLVGWANVTLAQHHQIAPSGIVCDQIAMRCAKKVSSVFDPNNGRIWSTWTIKKHLYLNYSDDVGATFSTPIKINRKAEKISTRGENRPKIAIDPLGNVYLSWVTPLAKRFTSNVRFSYLAANSLEATTPITVNNDGLLAGHSFNQMSVTADGDIFISWLDGRAKYAARKQGKRLHTSELYLGHANFSAGKREFNNTFIEKSTCVCCRIAMTLDDRNLPIMMWRHIFGDNFRDHSLITMINKTTANKMRRVSYENWQVNGCPHQGPALLVAPVTDQTQRIHMSWYNNAPDASGLFYAYSDNQGKSMSKVFHFAKQDKPEHPAMLTTANGLIYMVWREFNGRTFKIRSIHRRGEQPWSEAKTIAEHQGSADYPYLINIKGVAYLQWHRIGQPLKLVKL